MSFSQHDVRSENENFKLIFAVFSITRTAIKSLFLKTSHHPGIIIAADRYVRNARRTCKGVKQDLGEGLAGVKKEKSKRKHRREEKPLTMHGRKEPIHERRGRVMYNVT